MGEFTFGNHLAFLLLLGLPLLVRLYIRRGFGSGGAVRFSDLGRVRRLPTSLSMKLRHGLVVLRLLVLVLLIAALARPMARFVLAEQQTEGVDIVLVLDLSTSMAAEDLAPNKSRIDVAKEVAIDFVRQRPSDNIGLVSYAMYSTMRCPLTLHHTLLQQFIERLRTSRLVAQEGRAVPEEPEYGATAIGSGLASAVRMLRESQAKSKVVVLLTDGQNNAGIHPLDAAQAAKALGVKVHTIGVGSRGTAPIPVYTMFGKEYFQDAVDIDEGTLRRVAETTGGTYHRALDAAGLRNIFSEIDRLEKTKIKDQSYVRYEERYEPFVLAALVLLLIEQVLAHTRFRTLP